MKFIRKKLVIVGGLPEPVGGVTTFLRRLLLWHARSVDVFVDLYPAERKRIPENYSGRFICGKNKFACILWLIFVVFKCDRDSQVIFNFSGLRSLLLFLFIKKTRGSAWSLVLHHGRLSSELPGYLIKFILKKFDRIYWIGESQLDFYRSAGVNECILEKISPFFPPQIVNRDVDQDVIVLISELKKSGKKIIVGSGFPREIYQHNLSLRLVSQKDDRGLILFVYGDGELKAHLMSLRLPGVHVYFDRNEDSFNYALSQADLYVRPTLVDSFGVACADSIYFGTPVVASNVCERAESVSVYPVERDDDFIYACDKVLSEKLIHIG